ncbi:MAG: HK97 family phage prohead protease [Pseudomonadota bacterium]
MERAFIQTKMMAGDAGEISGIGWPFATPDRVGDMIEKGAFAETNLPLPMLFDHRGDTPLGSWSEATETQEGLALKGTMLVEEVERAREVQALVKAGAITGISIGFVTRKAKPRKGGGRTISKVELVEASLVAVPMHPQARITSTKDALQSLRIAAAIQRATAQFQARIT